MNRRSFLKRITAALVTAVAAPIIIREAIAAELETRKLLQIEELIEAFWEVIRRRREQAVGDFIEFYTTLERKERFIHASQNFESWCEVPPDPRSIREINQNDFEAWVTGQKAPTLAEMRAADEYEFRKVVTP